MHDAFHDHLNRIETRIHTLEGHYRRYLRSEAHTRKRERDVHLSRKDGSLLIRSFVIGGLAEKVFEWGAAKLFRF